MALKRKIWLKLEPGRRADTPRPPTSSLFPILCQASPSSLACPSCPGDLTRAAARGEAGGRECAGAPLPTHSFACRASTCLEGPVSRRRLLPHLEGKGGKLKRRGNSAPRLVGTDSFIFPGVRTLPKEAAGVSVSRGENTEQGQVSGQGSK